MKDNHMKKYHVFLYDMSHYRKGKKAVIRRRTPESYNRYDPVDEKMVIKSVFGYSKEGYKFTIELES